MFSGTSISELERAKLGTRSCQAMFTISSMVNLRKLCLSNNLLLLLNLHVILPSVNLLLAPFPLVRNSTAASRKIRVRGRIAYSSR